jgi:O-antigen/teichoic acid export membrane protein
MVMTDPERGGRTGQQLVSGSLWLGSAHGVTVLAGLVRSIVAARILPKQDLGLMGIALLAVGIIEQLSQSGFDKALIQRRGSVNQYLNVAWTWSVLRGLAIAAVLCAASWPLAQLYDEPVLVPILCATALGPILSGLQNVGPLFFSRELAFRQLFLMRSGQAVATLLVSVPAILLLRDVWALVLGYLAAAIVSAGISYALHPYRPRVEWNWTKITDLIDYGRWVTLTGIAVFIATSGDNIFVSKYFGPAQLASYQLAFQLANLPTTHISHIASQATFPVYARLQGDAARLRLAFGAVTRVVTVGSGGLAAAVGVMAPYIVDHVLGRRWAPIIPLIQILVVGGWLRAVTALAGPVFLAVGRSNLDFRMNSSRLATLVILIWPAAVWLGLEGVCAVSVLSVLAILPFWLSGLRTAVGLPALQVLRHSALGVASTAMLAGLLWLLRLELGPGIAAMGWCALLGAASWVALLWVLGRIVPGLDIFADISRIRGALRGDGAVPVVSP